MFRADYHTHSSFSLDSDAPMENMIISAISKGLNEIAFTDHVDFDSRYPFTNYNEYIPVIMDFKEKYKNRINIVYFNVYGHLDFVSRYGMYDNNSLEYKDYADLIDRILKELISRGKGIEVNTSGFRYGIDTTYPSLTILRRYKELGGEIITCGSDSHTVAGVGAYIDYAYELVKSAGFKYISTFKKQKPDFIKI